MASAAEGTVLAQDPPAHAQGIARPSVNLLVAAASEDEPDGFVMPDLRACLRDRAGNAGARGHQDGCSDDGECAIAPMGSGDAAGCGRWSSRAPCWRQVPWRARASTKARWCICRWRSSG